MKSNIFKSTGKRILKKSKRGVLRAIFSRMGLISLLFIVQIGLIALGLVKFGEYMPHVYAAMTVLAVVMVVVLINSRLAAAPKITWLIIISVFPVFGAMLYAYTRSDIGHRALKSRIDKIEKAAAAGVKQNQNAVDLLEKQDPGASALAKYVFPRGSHPCYGDSTVEYFSSGEEKFESVLRELKKAEKYVFLEYFIISKGKMWDAILDILVKKASEGVDIRIIYDGTCEFSSLPHNYPKILEKLGIKCKVFAPLTPFLSTHYNYRDHRKILVIDGKCAYTGGINLSDEYINIDSPYGHWKDSGVIVKGNAAQSFALMFIKMWSLNDKTIDFSVISHGQTEDNATDSILMPYSDCPLDRDKVGQRVYVDILNRAKRYVHIMTPYLILDEITENAIKYASERGVEVAILLPGTPDKKGPYALAKTHYRSLLESGVKIYEYTPGFVHSKVFCCDDKEAVVGTINLDYRSLYHHFECALYIYGSECISAIESDFKNTILKSRKISYDSIKHEKLGVKIRGFLLKSFAPLL